MAVPAVTDKFLDDFTPNSRLYTQRLRTLFDDARAFFQVWFSANFSLCLCTCSAAVVPLHAVTYAVTGLVTTAIMFPPLIADEGHPNDWYSFHRMLEWWQRQEGEPPCDGREGLEFVGRWVC